MFTYRYDNCAFYSIIRAHCFFTYKTSKCVIIFGNVRQKRTIAPLTSLRSLRCIPCYNRAIAKDVCGLIII